MATRNRDDAETEREMRRGFVTLARILPARYSPEATGTATLSKVGNALWTMSRRLRDAGFGQHGGRALFGPRPSKVTVTARMMLPTAGCDAARAPPGANR